jgi:Fe-S cluster assembly protein SufB
MDLAIYQKILFVLRLINFRINDQNSGQFERTLIIAEKNSQVNYLEVVQHHNMINQLHAAIVELVVLENANIKYSTVQKVFR